MINYQTVWYEESTYVMFRIYLHIFFLFWYMSFRFKFSFVILKMLHYSKEGGK